MRARYVTDGPHACTTTQGKHHYMVALSNNIICIIGMKQAWSAHKVRTDLFECGECSCGCGRRHEEDREESGSQQLSWISRNLDRLIYLQEFRLQTYETTGIGGPSVF